MELLSYLLVYNKLPQNSGFKTSTLFSLTVLRVKGGAAGWSAGPPGSPSCTLHLWQVAGMPTVLLLAPWGKGRTQLGQLNLSLIT